MGSCVINRLANKRRVETQFLKEFLGNLYAMGFATLDMQRSTCSQVPAIKQAHICSPKERTNTHHRPPIGPIAFPRVLLTLCPIYLFKAEEAPVHLKAELIPRLSHPK
jgi:hypothetical protein